MPARVLPHPAHLDGKSITKLGTKSCSPQALLSLLSLVFSYAVSSRHPVIPIQHVLFLHTCTSSSSIIASSFGLFPKTGAARHSSLFPIFLPKKDAIVPLVGLHCILPFPPPPPPFVVPSPPPSIPPSLHPIPSSSPPPHAMPCP